MEMIVKFQGTEGLERAIIQLAQAISGKNEGGQHPETGITAQQPMMQPSLPAAPQTLPQYTAPQQTYQQPPVQYQAPTQTLALTQAPIQSQAPAMPPAVPTSHTAQAYTQDQIAVAMTALCDAGKVDTVMGILSQFGAETLMQVPKEQYPALVTMMREAGANI